MTALFALVAIGAGLVIGGVAYTSVMGYNAFVMDLWMQAIPLVWTSPSTVFGAAWSGENAPLFQGVSMVSVGVLLLAISGFVYLARPLLHDITPLRFKRAHAPKREQDYSRRALFGKRKSNRDSEAVGDLDFSDTGTKEAGASGAPSTIQKIQARLNASRGKDEFTSHIDDEDDLDKPKGKAFGSGLGALFSKRKALSPIEQPDDVLAKESVDDAVARTILGASVEVSENGVAGLEAVGKATTRKHTRKVRVKKASSDSLGAKIQAVLDAAWDTALQNIGAKFSRKAVAVEEDKAGANHSESVQDEQLLGWYKSVQTGGRTVRDLIQESIALRDALDQEAREDFVERNSIDGAFILRLLDSWANRTDADTVGEETEDRAAIREAIRAVYRERTGQATKNDSDVPDEFRQDVDADAHEDDDGVDEGEDWSREYETQRSQEHATSMQFEGEDSSQEEDEMSLSDVLAQKLQEAAVRMKEYTTLFQSVKNGEDEWPPSLSEEDYRLEEVQEIDRLYSSASFAMSEEEIIELAETSEDDALGWLSENRVIVEHGFQEFVRRLDEGDYSEEDEGVEGADDSHSDLIPDLSVAAESQVSDQEQDQEQEARTTGEEEGGEGDDAAATQEDVPAETHEDQPYEEQDSPAVDWEEGGASGHEQSVVLPGMEEQDEEQDGVQRSQDDSLGNEESGENVGMTLNEDQEAEEEGQAALVQEDEDAEGKDAGEPEALAVAHEPVNVGVDAMQDMKLASLLVGEWGNASKEAGASGGTMMRFVSEKKGDQLEPAGFFNLVMLWKAREGKNRGNVIFRYLQEGDWRVDPDQPGRFVQGNGDWAEVPPLLLAHEESQKYPTAIHIHGPGATEELEQQAAQWPGLWVVRETPTASEILRRLEQP